jgi:hypothetical protein
MLDRLDRLELVDAIRQGLRDMEEGCVRGAREGLQGLEPNLAYEVKITDSALSQTIAFTSRGRIAS